VAHNCYTSSIGASLDSLVQKVLYVIDNKSGTQRILAKIYEYNENERKLMLEEGSMVRQRLCLATKAMAGWWFCQKAV
jgi:hypothetical protein